MSSRSQQAKGTIPKSNSFRGSYRLIFPNIEEVYVCPVCGYLLRDDKDFESYHEKDACTSCIDTYYHINADQWEKGWRPNKSEVRKNEF